ncbi:MAG: amidohydrolase family protein [Pseudomonadota bacterium]
MYDLVIRGGSIIDGTGEDAFTGDIAVENGIIADVGSKLGPGKREVHADGAIVTPGFVDAHTHYDGQVTWDPDLTPSSWHGVTTIVMGNCGVGFAPARPTEREFMIRVMEGVEEIPGAALEEGMTWNWETFPEYLDAIDAQERAIDVAAQVPHCALRCYVMGEERALDDQATPDDIAEMTRLTEEALRAGAVGFSTSRTMIHKVKNGPVVPGTHCHPEELLGIADAIKNAGHGVYQMISDYMGKDPDYPWMKEIARTTGGPLVFTLAQMPQAPDDYKHVLSALKDTYETDGLDIRAAVPWRPPGVLLGLQASLNPFLTHPSFGPLRKLSHADRLAAMRDSDVRDRILSEEATVKDPFVRRLLTDFANMFPLGDPPDYEPAKEDSIEARAARSNIEPNALCYDLLLQDSGKQFLYFPLANYASFNFDALYEMMQHTRSTASLSDGGAHVGTVSDASFTTFMLTHWVRDRQRGETIRLEDAIRKQTFDTANLYSMHDRGVIAKGKRADLNVIDFDGLHLHPPYMAFDLPTGGKRLLQKADGYHATFVAGEMITENGEITGARPGKLVRGPQHG